MVSTILCTEVPYFTRVTCVSLNLKIYLKIEMCVKNKYCEFEWRRIYDHWSLQKVVRWQIFCSNLRNLFPHIFHSNEVSNISVRVLHKYAAYIKNYANFLLWITFTFFLHKIVQRMWIFPEIKIYYFWNFKTLIPEKLFIINSLLKEP